MNKMKLKYKIGMMGIIISLVAFSCKKSTTTTPSPTPNPPTNTTLTLSQKMLGVSATGNEIEKVLDTMYLAALNVYYWNSSLPKYTEFNPRQYYSSASDKMTNMKKVLFAIAKKPTDAVTNALLDFDISKNTTRFSNIQEGSAVTAQGSNIQNTNVFSEKSPDSEGKGEGFGFYLGGFLGLSDAVFRTENGKLYGGLRIALVFPGSDAANLGLKRGDMITEINDVVLDDYFVYNADKTEFQNSFKSGISSFVNTAYKGTSMKLKIYYPSTKTFETKTLNSRTYESNPILKYTVLDVAGKKVGYIAYSSFQDVNKTKAKIDEAFTYFEQQGINMEDFIFDVRYNGGGYVSAAKYFLDKWAGSTQNGNIAFYEYYNADMQSGAAKPFLRNFKIPGGTLADINYSSAANTEKFSNTNASKLTKLKNFYFLVSGGTASASELALNSMRPYANVTVIGQKTYGKPVGFFSLSIGTYDVYFAMFESKNAKNEGGYYTGITPDYIRTDNSEFDLGNPNEVYIKTALDLISGKSLPKTMERQASTKNETVLPTLEKGKNYGMMLIKPSELKRLN